MSDKSTKSKLRGILQGDEEQAEEWLKEGMGRIDGDDLEDAIESDFNASTLLLNHFHEYMEHPVLGGLTRLVFKHFWDTVEYILTDANKIYNILTENRPDLKDLLNTPKGKKWLNESTQTSYENLYAWVWEERNLVENGE